MKYLQQRPSNAVDKQKARRPTGWLSVLRRHWQPITAVLSLVLMALTLLATLPGATNETYSLVDRLRGQSSTTSSGTDSSTHDAASNTQSATQEALATTEASPSTPTGCYEDDTPTPCGSPHSREVFSKPDGVSCDETSLILYMGGVAGVDLLGSGIDVTFFKNAEDLCVVERTSGMPNVSLKDIWTVDNDHNGYKDGGEFRRCFNRQGQATSCDADHASEEFYDAPEEVDCGKKYEDFSGRPVDRNIRVTRQSRDHRIVCRAEVQVSTDRLTASVRDLGNSTLPIKQN